jgi:hypothetical protein
MESKQNILHRDRQVLSYEAQLLLAGLLAEPKPLDFSWTFPHHNCWIQWIQDYTIKGPFPADLESMCI